MNESAWFPGVKLVGGEGGVVENLYIQYLYSSILLYFGFAPLSNVPLQLSWLVG